MFNPLLIKEIRTRMRGRTIFIVENIFLALLLGVILAAVKYPATQDQGWIVGQKLFSFIVVIQLLLLSAITPAIVASSITIEKEQKTYDMLLTTPLTARQIIANKLFASVSYFLVLLFLSIPMVSVAFILGGVSPKQMFFAFVVIFDTLLLAGMLGMYCSTIFNRTVSAVPVAMVIILLLLILFSSAGPALPAAVVLSPFLAFTKILGDWNVSWFSRQVPFWAPHLIIAALLLAWAFFSCVERIKDPRRRNMVPARLCLWIVLASLFIFSAGSMNFLAENLTAIFKDVKMTVMLCFILCGIPAVVLGGAPLSTRDFEDWMVKRSASSALIHRVFGGLLASAPAFTALVGASAGAAVLYSLTRFSALHHPAAAGAMIACAILAFSLMLCLLAKFLRSSPRIKSKTLPQIMGLVVALALALLPTIISDKFHDPDNLDNPVDAVLLLSPVFSVNAALDPENTAADHPYCQGLAGPVPPAIVPAAIYTALAALLALIGIGQEKRMRRFSRVEQFYLRAPDRAME